MMTTAKTSRLCRPSSGRTLLVALAAGTAVLLAATTAALAARAEAGPVMLRGISWSAPLPYLPAPPSVKPSQPDLPFPVQRLPIRHEPFVRLIPLTTAALRADDVSQPNGLGHANRAPASWAKYGQPLSLAELEQYDGGIGPLGAGLVVGAVGGAAGYGVEAYLEGHWSWGEFGSAVLSGAASGMTAGYLNGGGNWLGAARNAAASVVKRVMDWAWPF